jgi:alpha-galactosidase
MKILTGLAILIAGSLIIGCSGSKSIIYVDQLDLSLMESGWGENHINKSADGNPLRIAGKTYERGIGTHAVSKFLIQTNGNAEWFDGFAGVDDECSKPGTVEFQILGDRKVLWKSGVMKKGDTAKGFHLSLKGIEKMALLVTDGGDDINYDHADWIDAKITYTGAPPAVSALVQKEPFILTPAITKPRINGASVIGANPHRDFIFRVPVTGKSPLKIDVAGLPAGLVFDSENQVISGKAPSKGVYEIVVTASNAEGSVNKKITIRTDKGLSLTPPLGWNSWNCWGLSVDQDKVKAAADAMVSSGLADHGWTYINMDDGWEAAERNKQGELLANEKFPDMKSLTDYVHGLGLRVGIYSSPGPRTCGGFQGSYQNELSDAKTWAGWGIDYVKYDWCSYGQIAKDQSLPELKKPYQLMRKMLNQVDRDIVFSLCQYGMGNVWEWGGEVGGNVWRTTGDITDSWNSMAGIGFAQDKSSKYAQPGNWNDPDMLVVGKVGWGPNLHPSKLTPDEQYTHISLWALLASPLLIGCDMTQMDAFTLNLLTNDEVLEINQDPLGKQASPVVNTGGIQIWLKPLADGSIAIGVFNTGKDSGIESIRWDDQPNVQKVMVSGSDLGISGKFTVHDAWRQKDLGEFSGSFEVEVPFHGVGLYRVFARAGSRE